MKYGSFYTGWGGAIGAGRIIHFFSLIMNGWCYFRFFLYIPSFQNIVLFETYLNQFWCLSIFTLRYYYQITKLYLMWLTVFVKHICHYRRKHKTGQNSKATIVRDHLEETDPGAEFYGIGRYKNMVEDNSYQCYRYRPTESQGQSLEFRDQTKRRVDVRRYNVCFDY